ncbi:MAG: hypothetical protein HYR60_06025 [Acidobacteria bacterium]|nr:hypothetical protein [Acidobacteriota bacterium]
MLWTTAIPVDSVDVNLGKGEAVLDFQDVPLTDWQTIPNSLNPTHPLGSAPATLSLLMRWKHVGRRIEFKDPVVGFKGLFLENSATVAATARTPSQNFELVTNPATTVTHFAQVGHDHNGHFF